MDRHCQTALQLAQWLETHPAVAHVFYPGLASHPQHALATRQMKAFGGIVSIYLKEDSRAAAERVAQRLQLFALGESLGGGIHRQSLRHHVAWLYASSSENGVWHS